MITLALVQNVDTDGVYVIMPGSRGLLRGPYKALSTVAAGTTVLVASTDDGEQVVVGPVGDGDGMYNVRAFGAKGDGATDDTAAIQRAVNAAYAVGGGTVFVPDGVYMIDGTGTLTDHPYLDDDGGIAMLDNTALHLSPGAILRATPTADDAYQMIRVYDKSNVLIEGGRIEGERDAHTGTTGEYGFGIAVHMSDRVTIRDITIVDCWGDGIILHRNTGAVSLTGVPTDILIDHVVCDNNRRQGLSTGGANRLTITNSTFSNTGGITTGPCSGIDFEPWTDTTPVPHIDTTVRDCYFLDNAGAGIQLMENPGYDNVTIENCVFSGNLTPNAEFPLTWYPGRADLYIYDAGTNLRILNNRFDSVDRSSCPNILVTGTTGPRTGFVIAGNRFDGGLIISGADNVIVRDNTWSDDGSDTALKFDQWCNVGFSTNVLIDGNTINCLTDMQDVFTYGIVLQDVDTGRIVGNKILGAQLALVVSDSENARSSNIAVESNEIHNAGLYAIEVNESDGVRIVGNTIAGSCHADATPNQDILVTSSTLVQITDNVFLQAPVYAGAGAYRSPAAVVLTAGSSLDTRTAGNRVVPDGATAYVDISAPTAVTTGYLADDRGLMVTTTALRPTSPVKGLAVYDSTINKHVTFNGSVWKDGTDTTV